MDHQHIQQFMVVGIAVRTINQNGRSGRDISELWDKFMSENIAESIPNKIHNDIYSIYTDYESDHTGPYTTILGCKVSNIDEVPAGMVGVTINAANYLKYTAEGNLMEGAVYNEWVKIWNTELPRVYVADLEIYGEKAQDPQKAEVDIFIGVK